MRWSESESHSVVSSSLWRHGLDSPGILQARILEWGAFPFSRESSQPRDRTQVSHIAGRFFTPAEPPGKPKNTGVSSLSLLWGIFLIQELNWDLLHCRWALYQLSYQGSPQARLRVSSPCKEPSLQVQQGPRHQSVIVQNPKGMGNIHAFGGIGTTVENFISSVVFSDLERFCRPSPQGSQGSEFSWPSLRGNIPLLCIRAMFWKALGIFLLLFQ